MKANHFIYFAMAMGMGACGPLRADSATVSESYNEVFHSPHESAHYAPAPKGTLVRDGEDVKTGDGSRAELTMPSTTITRLGPDTIFNYSSDSNRIDLQSGTILFCKPKNARELSVKTAAITAGITGTTGFMSVRGSGGKKTYVFGIIEGHATASADGKPFLVGAGEIIEFKPGLQPFKFSFDLPRFVKSTSLVRKFKSTLPNQSYIDRAIADYQDDLSRGFIQAPKKGIDYSGDIPIFSTAAYDSAQNSQGGNRNAPPPPPPPSTGRYPFSPSGSGP